MSCCACARVEWTGVDGTRSADADEAADVDFVFVVANTAVNPLETAAAASADAFAAALADALLAAAAAAIRLAAAASAAAANGEAGRTRATVFLECGVSRDPTPVAYGLGTRGVAGCDG